MDTLTAEQGYDATLTYTWTVLPSGESLTLLNPPTGAVYVGTEGDEKILFTVKDPAGCESYDTVYIVLHLCEKELVIPNVFTPGGDDHSGDGKNDSYYIKDLCPIEDFKIIIFNRWGNIVYESGDYNFHWDGTDDNGKDCSEGVYYYTLHAKRKDLHGYIHLVRGKGK
jgi:gliding motility-associated-like protein